MHYKNKTELVFLSLLYKSSCIPLYCFDKNKGLQSIQNKKSQGKYFCIDLAFVFRTYFEGLKKAKYLSEIPLRVKSKEVVFIM